MDAQMKAIPSELNSVVISFSAVGKNLPTNLTLFLQVFSLCELILNLS